MKLTLKEAKLKYKEAKVAYYNGSPIMSDATFDRLEDWIRSKEPDWKGLKKTGVKVGSKHKVKLPFFMPSLNKCYPEAINEWFTKFPRYRWAYMAKLDGNSVLLEYKNGKPSRLITRGDGSIGQDISYFIPYLNIPKSITDKSDLCFRCEAILTKSDFEQFSSEFDNARNMVAGILNRKDAHKALKAIHFVVLGIFGKKLMDGLNLAFKLGFETVYCALDKPRFQVRHFDIIRNLKYEADGVVICNPDFTYFYTNSDKPKTDIIAYKENVEYKDTIVRSIIYQTSSTGRLIPKIEIEPIELAGAMIKYCTSHNAKWMIDHGIGINARVRITRSGDVIPKIIDVLEKGKLVYPACKYKQVGVHFVALQRSKEQSVRILSKFVTTLGIEGCKESTLDTMYDELSIHCISDLLEFLHSDSSKQRLKSVFGVKKGAQIYDSLFTITNTRFEIAKLMIASSAFNSGIGEKRLRALQEADFDLMELSKWEESKIRESVITPSIGESTAALIAEGLVTFHKFWRKNRKYMAKPLRYEKPKEIIGLLNGVNVTFTGYRDKEQESFIVNNGGKIVSFGAHTTVLLYKEGGKRSSKIEKAGSKALTFERFKSKYGL